jgi:multidrug/hemolysin transport system permease protein
MIQFVKRNLLIFFKDKASVFFSLLSVFIIIGLYFLFLGDLLVKGLEGTGLTGVRYLMDSWIMAGLLSVTPITTVLGALGIMIGDKEYKLFKDFYASPIKRSKLTCGYIISAAVISFIITLFSLVLAEIYIIYNGGELLSLNELWKVLALIILQILSSGFTLFLVVSFMKTASAFGALSTVLGTLIGFLTGIYIPIGNLPVSVQNVIKVFPPAHIGMLLRKIMMERAERIAFAGVPQEFIDQFHFELGVTFKIGDTVISPVLSILYLLIVTIIFFLLAVWRLSKKDS